MRVTSPTSPDEETKKKVAWSRATEIVGHPDHRIDCDGKIIRWVEYGQQTHYGWSIDYRRSDEAGDLDVLTIIQARHWQGCLSNK